MSGIGERKRGNQCGGNAVTSKNHQNPPGWVVIIVTRVNSAG
jgi:hypothetical protein